jgi:hypothetical protein
MEPTFLCQLEALEHVDGTGGKEDGDDSRAALQLVLKALVKLVPAL